MKNKAVLLSAVFLILIAFSHRSYGLDFQFDFTKIADTDTPVPDGLGTFDGPGKTIIGLGLPTIDATSIVFTGLDDTTFTRGIYLSDMGVLSKLVDDTTVVPDNPTAIFTGFDQKISLEGTTVAFEGFFDQVNGEDVTSYEGVFTIVDHALATIADTESVLIPGTSTIFYLVNQPGLSNGKLVFQGEDALGLKGFYSNINGTLQALVNTNTLVPGQSVSFAGFDSDVSLDGTSAAFEGFFDITEGDILVRYAGVYFVTEDILTLVADTVTTAVPGTTTPFNQIQEPSLDNGNVVFGGQDNLGNWGIYTTLGGALRVVADTETAVPGGTGLFTGFDTDAYAIDSNQIVFEGLSNEGDIKNKGLYLEMGGFLFKIIDTIDTLDGKAISGLDINFDRALSFNQVVFRAVFTDNSVGNYVATIAMDGSVSFSLIVDSDTPVPNGIGLFFGRRKLPTGLGTPAVDGDNVAFKGIDNAVVMAEKEGLYLFSEGSLSKMVDKATPVPGNETVNFTKFDRDFSLEGTTVAFEGFFEQTAMSYEGVYLAGIGSATMLADSVSIIVPGTQDIFLRVDEPALSDGKVAFKGSDDSGIERGIYSNINNTFQMIVNRRTIVPGQSVPFFTFDPDLSMDGAGIAFEGSFNVNSVRHRGAYFWTNGTLTQIADTVTTPVPGTTTPFSQIQEPSLDNGNVVFGGQDSLGNGGIYTTLGGALRVVADTGVLVPDGTGFFTNFDRDSYAIDDNKIVFEGFSDNGGVFIDGLYLEISGVLYKILDTTDLLDGKVISDLEIGYDRALSGNRTGFRAIFVDDSVGIYVAETLTFVTLQNIIIGNGTVSPQGREYRQGMVVELTAIPFSGWRLAFWNGTDSDASQNLLNTVTMDSDKTVMVNFELIPRFQLVTVVGGNGSVSSAGGPFDENFVLNLTAAPDPGWRLAFWNGTDSDASQNLMNTVTMDSDKTVTVNFELIPQFQLTTVVSGNGSVSPVGGLFNENVALDLTAISNPGWQLASWNGTNNDASNQLTNTVTMNTDKTVTVKFEQIQSQLSTTIVGGHGQIVPPNGNFAYGETVSLTAKPDTCYQVKSWSGTDNDTTKQLLNTITMTSSQEVAVEFEIIRYELNLEVNGEHGTITADANSLLFDCGTQVTMTAMPETGYQIKSWQGTLVDSSKETINTVAMDSHKTVVVEFEKKNHSLTTLVTGSHGSLSPASGSFEFGTVVPLTAIPEPFYRIKKWIGTNNDLSTDTTNTVTVDSDRTVTIEFEPVPVTLGINIVGEPHGTVPLSSSIYQMGETVEVVATPDSGFRIRRWGGTNDDSSTANTNRVTLLSESNVVTVEYAASIELNKFTVKSGDGAAADSFSVNGQLQATAEQFEAAETMVVQVGPYREEININRFRKSGSKPRFTYTRKLPGLKSIKLFFDKGVFDLTAKDVDLTGMKSPAKVDISFGQYAGLDDPDEELINGKKAVPICLLSRYANAIRLDKVKVKTDRNNRITSLSINGAIAAIDPDIDLEKEEIIITWGTEVFVIAQNSFHTKNGSRYIGKNILSNSGAVISGMIDLQRCTFQMKIKNINIPQDSDNAVFELQFGSFQADSQL